jgi:N-acetylglucosamine-6-sulfatase
MGDRRGTFVAALTGVVIAVALIAIGVGAAPSQSAATPGADAAAPKKKGPKIKRCTPRRKGAKPRKGSPLCPKQKRPNIVVIETDDLDDSLVGLPTVVRKLAQRGTTFSNYVVTDPLCCPSRATLLTGQYTHNHGVRANSLALGGGFDGFLNQRNSLPVWLRRAKYRTAHVGKYLNDYGDRQPRLVPPGWSEWHTLSGTEQRRWGYRLNRNGKLSIHGRFSGGPAKEYVTDVLSRINKKLIRRWAPSARPFYLQFDPNSPHGEGKPPPGYRDPRPAPRHLGRFESAVLPKPPNFNEADVSDKPAEVQARAPLSNEDINELTIKYRGRIESLLSVDNAIAKIIKRLKKAGELDDTVIIFTSDNGFGMGQHRIIDKNTPYEESTQVPLVIRGPGFPRRAQRTQLAGNIDLAPTIAQIAGAKPRRAQDGISLRELANQPSIGTGRDLLYENFTTFNSTPYVALRTPQYVYIERTATGERELYDLLNDPYELQSQHANPSFNAIEAQLANRLAALRSCVGAGCR